MTGRRPATGLLATLDGRWLRLATMVGLSAIVASVAGYALARGAGHFGTSAPLALVAVGVVPCVVLAVLADPRLGLVAVVLSFPIGVRQVPGTPVEVVQLLILAMATLISLRRLGAGVAPLSWAPPLWWVAALAAWSALALPSAADRALGIRAVLGLVVQIVTASAVLASSRTTADLRRLLAVLVAVVAGVGLTAPHGAARATTAFGGAVINGRAAGIFADPNQLGTFSAIGALVAAGLALGASTRRGRWAASVAGVTALVGLVLSLSRGAWIGFICGAIVLFVSVAESRRALPVVAALLIAFAAAIGALAPQSPQVQVVGARFKSIAGEKNPYDNRPAIWAEARKLIIAHPLVGAGPGSYPVVSVLATSDNRPTFADHAHDILLTWAAEDGLPAALLIIGLSTHLIVLARRGRRVFLGAGSPSKRRDAALLASLAAALVAVAGQGLVDYTLRNSVVYTTVFLVMGCLVAAERASRELPPVPGTARPGPAGSTLLTLVGESPRSHPTGPGSPPAPA